MPRPRSAVPGYLHRKPTNQAYVVLKAADGRRRTVYLGEYNSPASRAEYARLLAGGPPVAKSNDTQCPPPGATVAEVLLAYLRFAATYYVGPDGRPTSELAEYRLAARGVRELFAPLPATELGPKKLAMIRDRWVASGMTRKDVNRRVGKVKRMFRWAAAEELVPPSVPAALATLLSLAKGRTPAPETEPIRPVAVDDVETVTPFVRPEVAGMVRVQLLTGMRPGEVCRLRPVDVDRSGGIWVFRPAGHKGAWRGKDRAVSIGPKAQAVLAEYWPTDPTDYVFSPRRAVESLRAERSAGRVTPRYPSHMQRNVAGGKSVKARQPAACYTQASYQKAVARGVVKANAARAKSNVADPLHGPNLPVVPHWHPNQLRHTHGTLVRKRFGLEAAQVALGHARADVTEIYAERDSDLAAVIAAELG